MRSLSMRLLTFACVFALYAASSTAATVTMRFVGPITYVDPELTGAFALGDTFTALVTYESETPDSHPDPTIANYDFAISSVILIVGSYAAIANGGNITVENDSGRDAIFFGSSLGFGLTGGPKNGLSPVGFLVQLVDDSQSVLSSTAIPTSPIPTDLFQSVAGNQLSLNFSTLNPTGYGRPVVAEQFTSEILSVKPDPPVYLSKWGTLGVGDGEFNNPHGVAVDSLGDVYVTDSGNNRIQKFNGHGEFLTKWGASGTSDGDFNEPIGIAVDPEGKVWVVDSGNYRIQKFTPDGSFLFEWGSAAIGGNRFFAPWGIATDSAGNIYVTDRNIGVRKFTNDGTPLTQWRGQPDTLPIDFHGIAVDSLGIVYVTDVANQCVWAFASDGAFLFRWSAGTGADAAFLFPYGVAVDSARDIYVADTNKSRIQEFGPIGNFLTRWGGGPDSPGCSPGAQDGELCRPYGVAVDLAGNVYVVEPDYNRIQKFGPSGWTREGPLAQVFPRDESPEIPGTVQDITFSEVSHFGTTTVTKTLDGPAPPSGFSLGDPPVYFDINTTATLAPGSLITICINYAGLSFADESQLLLFHQASGAPAPENITTFLDTEHDVICGEVSSLSPFMILEPAYRFVGFLEPVQNAVLNVSRAGSAIPLKWQLLDKTGIPTGDLSLVTRIGYQLEECTTGAEIAEIEGAPSSGTSGLRYDPDTSQYIYIWKTTESMAGNCFRVDVTLLGSWVRSAHFRLR